MRQRHLHKYSQTQKRYVQIQIERNTHTKMTFCEHFVNSEKYGLATQSISVVSSKSNWQFQVEVVYGGISEWNVIIASTNHWESSSWKSHASPLARCGASIARIVDNLAVVFSLARHWTAGAAVGVPVFSAVELVRTWCIYGVVQCL